MPGRNKHPLLGWHPKSAEDVAWLRAEAKRRGVTLAVLLDDALAQYRSGCQWMLAPGEVTAQPPKAATARLGYSKERQARGKR